MAHVVDYMIDPGFRPPPRNFSPSPQAVQETMKQKPAVEDDEKEKYVWRMHQPTENRKYQLFPAPDKLTITPPLRRRSPDREPLMAQQPPTVDRQLPIGPPKLRRELPLSRWRKPSVSDLGPMTTVQEVSMDSPTIPGRPPVHERSTSAPGHSIWRRNIFGDSLVSLVSGPVVIDETSEVTTAPAIHRRRRSDSPKSPWSPRNLTPLFIAPNIASVTQRPVARSSSDGTLRGDDEPPEVPPKSARMFNRDKTSPQTTQSTTPYTPGTASSLPLASASATPNSAFSDRSSPFSAISSGRGPSPVEHHRSFSSSGSTSNIYTKHSHKRNESDASVMDRGRPKKRNDGSPGKSTKQSTAAEQLAFETLPLGFKACDASTLYHREEVEALKNQAIGQAVKFEVLCSRDVDILSKELRGLDERCKYLRKTYKSLRSGRRNLHLRICTYLRSPREARFSHESLLKQEEALSELDISIDDWVSKLEQAENRRTRVRQKLLEHVAAAVILDISKNKAGGTGEQTPPRSPTKALGINFLPNEREHGGKSPSPHRLARIVPPTAMMPPPPVYGGPSASSHRIPTATSTIPANPPPCTAQSITLPITSPPTVATASAQLQATVFGTTTSATATPISPLPNSTLPTSSTYESAITSMSTFTTPSITTFPPHSTVSPMDLHLQSTLPTRQPSTSSTHSCAESIRIYADSDVFALLADVEDEIKRLGQVEEEEAAAASSAEAEAAKQELQGGEILEATVFGLEI